MQEGLRIIGTGKFGIGPTILVLKQKNGWTYGALANQVWSVAGDEERNDVNQLYAQPFCGYNWKSGAGITVDSEITHNWETNNTSAYLVPQIAAVTKLGKQMVQLLVGFPIQMIDANKMVILA